MNPTKQNEWQDDYQINDSLRVVHYKETEEIVLVNCDDGSEFLLADLEEADQVAHLILQIKLATEEKLNEPSK